MLKYCSLSIFLFVYLGSDTALGLAREVYKISIAIWSFIGLAWMASVFNVLQTKLESFTQKVSLCSSQITVDYIFVC